MDLTPLIQQVNEEEKRAKNEGISLNDAALLVAQECKQATNTPPLWHNAGSKIEAFASHPKPTHFGSHLITLIDYALPTWTEYPQRSHSFILTTTPISNPAYRAFPIDGAKLVAAPSMYFGSCFKPAFNHLNLNSIPQFDDVFEIIYHTLNEWSKRKEGKNIGAKLTPNTIEQFIIKTQYLLDNWPNHELMFDRAIEKLDYSDIIKGKAKAIFMLILKHGDNNFLHGLDKIFNPATNNFRLMSINKYDAHNGEVWTDAPCIMVRGNVLGEIQNI